MLGETANDAQALLASKQGQGEITHGGKEAEATLFRGNDMVTITRLHDAPS